MTKTIVAALMVGGVLVAGGGHGKHRGGYVYVKARPVANYAFDSSSSSSSGYGGYSSYSSLASSSSSSSSGYNFGALGDILSSSSSSSFGGYGSYGHHGPPEFPKLHGKHHGPKKHHGQRVQKVIRYVPSHKVYHRKRVELTHQPVYHKTVVNHVTAHDVEKKDVYHHIGQEEKRFENVAGKTIHAGREDVDHGKMGHGAYQSIVSQYKTSGRKAHATAPRTVMRASRTVSRAPIITEAFEPMEPSDSVETMQPSRDTATATRETIPLTQEEEDEVSFAQTKIQNTPEVQRP